MLTYSFPAFLVSLLNRGRMSPESQSGIRILIVRADGLGDFILFIPFLRSIRSLYPNGRICLVVRRNVFDLAETCPYVDELLVVADPPVRLSPSYLRYLCSFAKQHLRERFDLVLQPRWDVDRQWATLIAYLSRAPRIVGFTEKNSISKAWDNWLYNRLLTDVVPPGSASHESERNLDIVRYLGGAVTSQAEFWLTEEDKLTSGRLFEELEISGALPIIAFGIGAGDGRRQWPFYGELIRLLLSRYNFVPLLVAGPQDVESARQIAERAPESRVLLARPLRQVGAILSRCDLFIGNDSGPMHLASAANLPVVAISCHPIGGDDEHANSPRRFGPIARISVVIRPNEFSGRCSGGCLENSPHCIRTILPERVADETLELLARSSALTPKSAAENYNRAASI
jgi:heptosyltransferase-2